MSTPVKILRSSAQNCKPILKWAGGKTQLLEALYPHLPKTMNRYIEPFFGAGALYFSLQPKQAIVSDSNAELMNVYRCLVKNVEAVIRILSNFKNSEKFYYKMRALDATSLDPIYAAARTLYLNKTCYNGLYRVNQQGGFNVPYGRYKNPTICPSEKLREASKCLKKTKILCGDYKKILHRYAKAGDFIFLDPPYLPIGKYSDFKRYTKEQFYEEDHQELAAEVMRLQKLGCHLIVTNSNHPLVHELYASYQREVVNTRRYISSKPTTRHGEDVIVTVQPYPKFNLKSVPSLINDQAKKYPSTRFMGSKEKLLPYIQDVVKSFEYESVLDLFSGSGVVSYFFKSLGKTVYSNDYMGMSTTFTKALVENSHHQLSDEEINTLFLPVKDDDKWVQRTFQQRYFSDEDNRIIDRVRQNIQQIRPSKKRAIAMMGLIRACLKKRPRGIFTYTGMRYDDGRLDLRKSLADHIETSIKQINAAVFDNGKVHHVKQGDALSVRRQTDLVYIDPPYYSPLSDNEYVRRYHFVEGLARDWKGVDIQWHTKTRKFKNYPTPFSSRTGAFDAFNQLFHRHQNSILVVSYSSNSLPTREEMLSLLSRYKTHVEVLEVPYRYSAGTQKCGNHHNAVSEYLFIGF
ncbi:MAG: Dam family site-specific DNA-(adenine-N6)-methyltransferase [Gammaproteobacteria bacterium]|nr:Dam family site-specific DNA-(adenine-N6)-methyltransferase [Gammaproteobacteria bacterium]